MVTKMCWATFWAIFFTNSSGHPAADAAVRLEAAITDDPLSALLFDWLSTSTTGLPDFSSSKHTKIGKIYQLTTNYTKLP
jgi:hypothetical protein